MERKTLQKTQPLPGSWAVIVGSGIAGLSAASVLDGVLSAARFRQDRTGLAHTFQKKLASSVAVLWQQAVRNDWRWPATEISDNTEELYALLGIPA